jgi:hypothetical protein
MATSIRKYNYPYVVEKSKITRLVDIIQENIVENEIPYTRKFTVNLSRGGNHEAESLDKIFELVNPQRNRITNFEIHFAAPKDCPQRSITIGFSAHPENFIFVFIASSNINWMTKIFSLVEEQIERMFQFHNQISRIIISNRNIFIVVCLLVIFSIAVNVFPKIFRPEADNSSYWLIRNDINEFDKILKDKTVLTNEDLHGIFTRQIRNVINNELHQKSILGTFGDLRAVFISIPIAIIILSLMYLISRCYLPAVFLWGDMEDWYHTIVNRRKTIWNVIIGALLIGILGSLFVFGITDFLRP